MNTNNKGFTWVVGLGMGDGDVTFSVSRPLNTLPPREQTLVTEVVKLLDEYAEENIGELIVTGDELHLQEAAHKMLYERTFVGRVKKALRLLWINPTKRF